MSSAHKLAVRSRAFREEGRCYACGEEVAPGHKLCQGHLDYQRAQKRAVRSARRSVGACGECGTPSPTFLCPACTAVNAEIRRKAQRRQADKRRRAKLIRAIAGDVRARKQAAGLCEVWTCRELATRGPRCKAHADPDHRRRREAEQKRAFVERRRAAGLCWQCGFPNRTAFGRCEECRAAVVRRKLELRIERRVAGLCVCGRRRPRRGALCSECARKKWRKERRRRRGRVRLGLCTNCENQASGGTQMCERHRAMKAARQARLYRRRRGLVWKTP